MHQQVITRYLWELRFGETKIPIGDRGSLGSAARFILTGRPHLQESLLPSLTRIPRVHRLLTETPVPVGTVAPRILM